MKIWRDYELTVNGLAQRVRYNRATVDNLFIPLLEKLAGIYRKTNRRTILFLVAPPATGKSTLTLFLEKLSRERDDLIPVQAVGMDGFHYHADWVRPPSRFTTEKFMTLLKTPRRSTGKLFCLKATGFC